MLDVTLVHGSNIDNVVNKYKLDLELLLKVKEKFPDASLVKESRSNVFNFSSKLANRNYTNLEFKTHRDLWVYPSHIINIKHNGKDYSISVKTKPQKMMLVRRSYTLGGKDEISFPSTKNNFKRNNFNQESLFKDCRLEIINFLKNYSEYTINTDNADNKIIKLLSLI